MLHNPAQVVLLYFKPGDWCYYWFWNSIYGGVDMNQIIKNFLVGIASAILTAAIAATASIILTSQQVSASNALLIQKVNERIDGFERRFERIEDYVYRHSRDN